MYCDNMPELQNLVVTRVDLKTINKNFEPIETFFLNLHKNDIDPDDFIIQYIDNGFSPSMVFPSITLTNELFNELKLVFGRQNMKLITFWLNKKYNIPITTNIYSEQ